jgi:ABC-type uncharacterized transport system permease subunit
MHVGKTIMGVAAVVIGRRLLDIAKGWNDARARFRKGGI